MTEREQKLQAEIEKLMAWQEEAIKVMFQAGAKAAELTEELRKLKAQISAMEKHL